MQDASGYIHQWGAGGGSKRIVAGPTDPDYGDWSQGLSLLWEGENDPERTLACLVDKPGRQEASMCRISSLKVYLWEGASVNPNRTTSRPTRRRVLSFPCKNDVYLPMHLLQMPVPVQNTPVTIARISKNDMDSPLEGAKLLDWIPIASGPRLRSSKLYPELRSAPLRIQS